MRIQSAVLEVIAKGQGACHPNFLALGGGDLVPDAIRGDPVLELGKDRSRFRVSRPIDVVVLNQTYLDYQ